MKGQEKRAEGGAGIALITACLKGSAPRSPSLYRESVHQHKLHAEQFCSSSEDYKGTYALPHQCHLQKPAPQTEPRCAIRPQDKVSSCHIISKSRRLTESKCPSIGDGWSQLRFTEESKGKKGMYSVLQFVQKQFVGIHIEIHPFAHICMNYLRKKTQETGNTGCLQKRRHWAAGRECERLINFLCLLF